MYMIKTESTMVTIPLSRWEHAVLGLSGVVSLTVHKGQEGDGLGSEGQL